METEVPNRYRSNGAPRSRKSKSKCKSCNACRHNPRLRLRYYHAWFERQPGEETLEMIGQELGISNQAIYRHAHNHMKRRVEKSTVQDRIKHKAELVKVEAMKELEVSLDHENLIPREDYEKAVDDVIAEGIVQLKAKDKDVTINQLLAAAKIKGDWAVKKRGQNTELIKTMYRSASGFTKKPSVVVEPGTD